MNPSNNTELSGLNLPSPIAEQPLRSASEMPPAQGSPETAPMPVGPEAAPRAMQPPSSAVPVQPMATPDPFQQGAAAQTVASSTTNSTIPAAADDADLIEKEWVTKAKQIVEKNRDDPYRQSKEMTFFKADYMRKRYNKTIKLSE